MGSLPRAFFVSESVLAAIPVHAESPRYAASLVFIPGLWAGPSVWQGPSSFLAHRGWEGHLLDLRTVGGGLGARAVAVAEFAAALPVPAVLLGHGAGTLVALAAAARGPVAAVVGVAPLVPGSAPARALLPVWSLLALLRPGRPVPPPDARVLGLEELSEGARRAVLRDLTPEDASAVLDVARRRVPPAAPGLVPVLVLSGGQDPLLPPAEAAAFAAALGADHRTLEGGHWFLVGSSWQAAVDIVHRWLVLRLGESLLELYPEAMAERDVEDPE